MKEHRTKALRVTTTSSLQSKDEPDLFGGLQLLQLELSTGACVMDHQWSSCKSKHQSPVSEIALTDNSCGNSNGGLIQECISCRSMLMDDLYITPSINKPQQKEKVLICSCPKAGKLCSANRFNLTPLYLLLTGNLGSWPRLLDEVRRIIASETKGESDEDWLNWTDSDGNNALLIGGQRLLNEGEYNYAADLVNVLVDAGCNPNSKNIQGRSLLSYSVQYMDESLPLTRLLLNSGASVWPSGTNGMTSQTEEGGCSVFTWFLRGVMRRRRLDSGCHETLSLLAQVMGECPHKMHAHVMRTMFKHAKCYRVLGPVFLQMKLAMASYWAQPQQLQFLCRRIIRQNLFNYSKSHKNKTKTLNLETVSKLGLPPKVQSYIMLQ